MAFVEEQVIQDYWLQKEIAKRITRRKAAAALPGEAEVDAAEEEVHARHILVATEHEAKDLMAS
jgi:peptidyl-prolyl cis-trans isomerase C